MADEEKDALIRFFEQLDKVERELIKDYLKEKKLESLSKSFDSLIGSVDNETKED